MPPDDHARLNAALASQVPLARLAKQWGISRTALRAHRANHIGPALVALRKERHLTGVRKVAGRVEDLVDETDSMYQAAKKASHMPLALKAVREQRGNYELLARITGELDDRPQVTVNIQQTAAFIAVRSVIFEELEHLPEVRARISRRLKVLAENEAS